jgi:hypothetical protein
MKNLEGPMKNAIAVVIALLLAGCVCGGDDDTARIWDENAELKRSVAALRVSLAESQRHLAAQNARNVAALREALAESHRQLVAQNARELEVLNAAGVSPPCDAFIVPGPVVPSIEAKIMSVRPGEPTLVLLDAGASALVEKGFHFSVYRGDLFVGKVVAESVGPDLTGCRVLFTREGETIRPGDLAATRLH